MRGIIVIVAIVCLLSACSNIPGGRSVWDYYSPENVRCADTEIEYCRQYGPHMICECIA